MSNNRIVEVLSKARDLISTGWTPLLAMRPEQDGWVYCVARDPRALRFSLESALERAAVDSGEFFLAEEIVNAVAPGGLAAFRSETGGTREDALRWLSAAIMRARRP